MSSVAKITSLSDQAIAWVILLHSGTATELDKSQAEQWQKRTLEHQKAYLAAEQLWLEMGTALQQQALKAPPAKNQPSNNSRSLALTGLAAAILLFAALNPFTYLSDRWLSDYHTAIGEQKRITLSDGSSVILNTDTALSVEWNQASRRIKLLRGQAQFTVAPDLKRPFEVATDDAVVKALGTIFEVLDDTQSTRVTVLEHAVGIKAATASEYPNNARIQAGQQARYSLKNGLESLESIDIKQNAAWQRGKLIVKNQPLVNVIDELNRYYSGKIVMTNNQLPALRVTGVFPLDNPVAVLSMLEHSLPLKVKRITPWLAIIHSL
ncbi:MAG: FecR family protein [Methylococcales bacterium]